MASFGTDHIVYPYERFGEYLANAIDKPASCRLAEMLVGVPGRRRHPETEPPRGHWVVCGYGRFGQEVVKSLNHEGLDVTIIEPNEIDVPKLRCVRGQGTEAHTLIEAGVRDSVGIVAGTDDDINNLSIIMTAKALQPELYVVLRQNLQANYAIVEACRAQLVMVPSEIIAHEIFALITTPLLSRFLSIVQERDNAWAGSIVRRLAEKVGHQIAAVWSIRIEYAEAPALVPPRGGTSLSVTLAALLCDPADRSKSLSALPLLLLRANHEHLLPESDLVLERGDYILFAGTPGARSRQTRIVRNANVLDYVQTGRDAPGGWIWQKLNRGSRGVPAG